MNFISQTFAVTILNLRTIPQRLGSSGVAIVGIAGVVIVLVSVLSIAQGFAAAMEQSGSDNRALVMRSGADSEMTSGLGPTEVDIIKQAPGLRRDGQTAVASAELYVIIDIPKIGTNSPANVPVRGIEPTATVEIAHAAPAPVFARVAEWLNRHNETCAYFTVDGAAPGLLYPHAVACANPSPTPYRVERLS